MTSGTGRTEIEASSAKHLRGKYAVVGIGETPFFRGSGKTTRALGVQAVANAMADAGLTAGDVDGILSYQAGDSTPAAKIAADLGIRPDFYMDIDGGGSSTETLIGVAMGIIEAGMCNTVAIYRAMNGYSQYRYGGTGEKIPLSGDALHGAAYGWFSPAQRYAPSFMRHMHDFGTRSADVAMVKVIQSEHASNNPRALYRNRVSVEHVLGSRMIAEPLHLLDCCLETDNASCIIVTRVERARDLRQAPCVIRSVVGRVSKPRTDMHFQHGPITRAAGWYARDLLWGNAGLGPDDVDVTGCYDCFSFATVLQFEAYGFCAPGEGGGYVSDGTTRLGGRRPSNTSGGQLCEGYNHGMNLVIETVRQLRGDADDSCPIGPDGRRRHTFDYREGGCRQVEGAAVAANLGWVNPGACSGLVMVRE